jgi:hypothetical protein
MIIYDDEDYDNDCDDCDDSDEVALTHHIHTFISMSLKWHVINS